MEPWLSYAALYVLAGCMLLRLERPPALRDVAFCLLNLLATYACFFAGGLELPGLCLYVGCVLLHYLLLAQLQAQPENNIFVVLAVGAPLLALLAVKLLLAGSVLGFSYLSFRLAYTAYEMAIGRVTMPQPWRYVGFALFPLTFPIGPINPYNNYSHSLARRGAAVAPYSRCLGRILVGILKCYIIGSVFKTMTFATYWDSNFYHNFTDFTVSSVCTALYIYFNFSGATDIMIGAAGLMGIRVAENFNNPFLSRNLAEFWTRNHITLANVARDIAYTPASLWLMRKTRGRFANSISAVCTILTFFIIGIWHGNEAGFALFGLMHGIGVAAVNWYGSLSRRFPPHVRARLRRPAFHALCVFATFMYVSYSTVFFGSDWRRLESIWFQLH